MIDKDVPKSLLKKEAEKAALRFEKFQFVTDKLRKFKIIKYKGK